MQWSVKSSEPVLDSFSAMSQGLTQNFCVDRLVHVILYRNYSDITAREAPHNCEYAH